MRLRRTGAVRSRSAPLKPTLGPTLGGRRSNGKYWLPVMLVAVVLFFAQCRWIEKAKKQRVASLDSPLANKIAEKMLAMKGIPAEGADRTETGTKNAVPAGGWAVGAAGGVGDGLGQTVPCETCEGTGRAEDGGPCPLCFGHGARFLRRTAPDQHICPSCVGMGRILLEDGTAADCPRCSGRGLE